MTSNHYCPGCGASQKAFLRYPWHFCKNCLLLAEDFDGRRLAFGNMSLSGGLYWKLADSPDVGDDECSRVLCLIHGRPVIVTEARFGGVVAQPLTSESANLSGAERGVDLRRKS